MGLSYKMHACELFLKYQAAVRMRTRLWDQKDGDMVENTELGSRPAIATSDSQVCNS